MELTAADVTAARDALAAERRDAVGRIADLTRTITGIAEATAGANTDDEHDPEGATIAFERAQASAVLDQARDRVRRVDAALARLEEGTWGTCTVCGGAVPAARMAARPTATTHVGCTPA